MPVTAETAAHLTAIPASSAGSRLRPARITALRGPVQGRKSRSRAPRPKEMSAQVFEKARFAEEIGAFFGWFFAKNRIEYPHFHAQDAEMSAESLEKQAKTPAVTALRGGP